MVYFFSLTKDGSKSVLKSLRGAVPPGTACALYTTASRSRQKVNYPSRQPIRIPLPASLLRGGCVSTAIGSSEFLPCFSSLVHTTWLGLGLGLGLGLSLESGLATPNLLISPHYLPQQHAVVVDAVRVDCRLQHEIPLLLLLNTTYYYYYSHSLPLTPTYYHLLPLTTTYHYCSLLPLTIHDYFYLPVLVRELLHVPGW